MKEKLSQWFSTLLSFFETQRVKETIINLDEQGFMILGGCTALLVIICLIKRMVRTAVFILGVCATVVLLHFTIPEEGVEMSFNQILGIFIGGAFIVATTIYFMIIRSD